MNKLLFPFLLFLLGCSTNKKEDDLAATPVKKIDSLNKMTPSNLKIYDSINKNIGFVGITDEIDKKPLIKILNLNQTLFKSISLQNISKKVEFEPYAYHPDNYLLWFRCISKNKKFYTIIINEKTKLEKLINISDENVAFSTWEELILHSFSVDFDYHNNPIKKEISDSSEIILYDEDAFYHAIKISGDWLKIKWENGKDWSYGYIKWKQNNKLLIELFFFA